MRNISWLIWFITNRFFIIIISSFFFLNTLSAVNINTKIDSLNLLLETSADIEKIDILNELSTAYDTISHIKSLDYAIQALELTRKYKKEEDIAVSLDKIGRIHFYMSNYDKSIDYFLESLKRREKIGNKKDIAQSYNNLGVIYLYLANFNKALEYLQKAWDVSEGLEDEMFTVKLSNNLGIVYMNLANYEKALEYYQKTLNNSVETNNKKLEGTCLNNIGIVYWYLEDYKKALEYYLNAVRISEDIGDKWSISNCSRNIGDVYIKLQDYNNSLLYLNKGLKIAEEIESKHLIKDCYGTFSDLYYAKGNYKKAYDYNILYSEIKDSIFSEEKEKNIAEMEVKFETEKKEKEIEILEKEHEINVLKLKKHKIQRNLLIITSLFILLLIIILYSRFLLKKKTNKQLKIAVKKISKSEADLKESNTAKDKFFTIISHDLKGPFNSLLGFSRILTKKAGEYDKEKIVKFSNTINTSAQDLYDLTENLLLWGRTQSGNLKNNPEKVNLRESVINNISVLKSIAEKKNIILYQEIPENTYVYVDIHIVSMIIRNLMSNALKFTDSGGKIGVTSVKKDNFIEISVIDTGIGISEESRKKLFRIDVHYTTKGTSDERGTGLGLILCKEFVEKSGGEICVESEPGKGSTFKFTLPEIS
ncbi:MAG: tetratricopeptide repeat-containing sensor histidine kinase [Bacteroidales bacterium]|nr:tetratricopeptide repeat-containing sensor histidine kinase [Bacteroidales bacterium]